MRVLLVACLVCLLLAGCSNMDSSQTDKSPTPSSHSGNLISLAWPGNVTVLLPILAPAPTELTTYVSLRGAYEDGFAIKYIPENPAKDGFVDYAPRYDRLAFADFLYQSKALGQRTVKCAADNSTHEPCPRENQTHWPLSPSNYTHSNLFIHPLEVPAGYGYLLIDAKAWTNISLDLSFSSEVQWGSEIDQTNGSFWWSQEFFDADFAYLQRCIHIAWCGTMVNGQLNLDFAGHQFILLDDYATAQPGGYLRLCLVQAKEVCAQPNLSGAYPLVALAASKDGPAHLTLDAATIPAQENGDTSLVSSFHVGDYGYRFSIPDHHPLRS